MCNLGDCFNIRKMRMESGGRVKTILNLGSKKKDGPINRDDEVREKRWLVIKKGKREKVD